ncbi:NTE family protein rssA [Weeksella virosa]|uniref:patatin-like phospholipase family protein n=1 Tax=Weeksella virosa TaxID=1014 RepID=UPI000E038EA7|nr:patatin-like phospholipase family protein [Weeksella virosa]SUP54010.1 NTE family protein rssA [Weeksella virosa]
MKKLFAFVFVVSSLLYAQPPQKNTQRPKVGVVLSGGGAKGYAHIGALKKIEEAGIHIDYIGGTSMGAIVGGLYAAGYTPDELSEITQQLDLTNIIVNEKNRQDIPFFNKTYQEKYILELPFNNFKIRIPQAISTGQGTQDLLTYMLRNVHATTDFKKLPTPFFCVATDIETGQPKVFHEGFLPKVMLASAAYPSMIKPVEIDNHLYIDGGVLNNFPADEMKKMGADIIIGVDVEEGKLKPKEEIGSAIDVISQIISFNIVENSTQQKKLADLIIRPDIDNYTVTSFENAKEIIAKGLEAGDSLMSQLKEIAARQNHPSPTRPIENRNDFVLIRDVKTSGLKKFNDNYVEGRFGIKAPELLNYQSITDGINRLYATDNFSNVTYIIDKDSADNNILHLNFTENQNKQFLKFGLHYDDVFKTGLLLNFTSKNILLKNTNLSADFVVGDYFRYNINFYIDNGYFPSFGASSNMHYFDYGIQIPNENKNELNYRFRNFVNRLYIQSTLREKYAVGVGLEHQFANISTNNYISDSTRFFKPKEEAYFLKGFAYLKVDNRDNPNYARIGSNILTSFSLHFDSNAVDFEKYTLLKAQVETNLPINNFLSYRFTANFGTFFNENISNLQKFILGGYIEQNFLNYTKFHGLRFGSAIGENVLTIGSNIQAKLLKNHYVNLFANIGNLEDELDDIRFTKYRYIGYGISYGYDSPFGPINGFWTYSPQTKKGLFNVSLGFWF